MATVGVGVGRPGVGRGGFGEEDAGYLQQRLDDLGGMAAAVRWRVRGAEAAWERLQLYQRVEVAPVSGQAFFGLAERDPGESGWSDFRTFYYAVQGQQSEWVVGDLRPGTGAGLVFGRSRRGTIAPRMSAGDSRRLGYRSSGENHALRGVAWHYKGRAWSGMLLGGWAHRDGRLDEQGQVKSLPESGYHVTATEVAGRDLLGIRAGGGRLHWRGEHWQGARPCWPWAFPTASTCAGMGGRLGLCRRRAARGGGGYARGLGAGPSGVGGGWRWGGALGDGGGVAGAVWRAAAADAGPLLRAGFHSFFGAAPGTSAMQNERGGVAEISGRGWRGYVDVYRRPARSYFIPVPAMYATWGGELKRRLGRWAMRGQWQRRLRPHWADERLGQERSHKWRLDLGAGEVALARRIGALASRYPCRVGPVGQCAVKMRWLAPPYTRAASARTRGGRGFTNTRWICRGP